MAHAPFYTSFNIDSALFERATKDQAAAIQQLLFGGKQTS